MKNEILKTLFICATHGDEEFSIPIMEKIEQKYSKKEYNYDYIVGNPKALEQKVRFIDVDLNRNAPGVINSSSYEKHRATEIINIAKKFDFVIDIHGAKSDCGVCTIISKPSLQNLLLATQLNCKNNVVWNSTSSKYNGPLNQHIGKPAIELECGPKNSKNISKILYKVISEYLERQNKLRISNKNDKWFAVTSKQKKIIYKDDNQIRDFEKYKSKLGFIIPFLSQNTYEDGSFYSLTEIDFDQLFER